MEDYREIWAQNLVRLRTERGITQLELAGMLNYSDKAVSKWERGEAVPDIAVIKQVADLFGVTVDYLITKDHPEDATRVKKNAVNRRNRVLISALATMLVWLIATFLFVEINLFSENGIAFSWLVFVCAVPLSAIVLLIFNSIWGRRRLNFIIISLLIWSALAGVFLTFLVLAGLNLWLVFILGIPAEIILLLWSGLTLHKR